MDFSLNVTAALLFISSTFIITGSSIWIFIDGIGPANNVAIASCNLVSVIGMGIAATLIQLDVNKKNTELHRLRVYSPNIRSDNNTINIPEL